MKPAELVTKSQSGRSMACFAMLLLIAICIISCKMYYPVQKVNFRTIPNPSSLENGKKLTLLMCGVCHYDEQTKRLTGKRMNDVPGIAGKVYSANITRDQEEGITRYTDSEIAFLIRTGISREGKLMPYMQKPNLADEDLASINAFLRSDDELTIPTKSQMPETKYTPAGKLVVSSMKALPYRDNKITKPDKSDKVSYGYYLVDNLDCYKCHSSNFMKINKLKPDQSKGYLEGGVKLKNMAGRFVTSPPLTFRNRGIEGWSEADLRKALRDGVNKDNEIITFPMPRFKELSDPDISAIYAYLKSVPCR